jgi:hypothetical protein
LLNPSYHVDYHRRKIDISVLHYLARDRELNAWTGPTVCNQWEKFCCRFAAGAANRHNRYNEGLPEFAMSTVGIDARDDPG